MFIFVLLCNTCVHSSFAIILKRKRELVTLLLLYYRCMDTINVLRLFLVMSWVGLQCVIVVYPVHTHMLFQQDTRLLVCFVVLRPKSTAMVMAGRSIHLTTRFPRQA